MSEITNKSIERFLDELAGRAPTPGGGSVAALMGAQAAALIGMVCHLTIGKPQYSEVETDLCDLLSLAESMRLKSTSLIEADVEVFNRLMACYGMPKATDEQRIRRVDAIQAVLKEATEIPMACAKVCAEAIELSRIAAAKGSASVVSDAGVAVMAAYAGLKSAALNVYINTGNIKDKAFAELKITELEAILQGKEQLTDEVYEIVKSRLSCIA